MFYVNSLTVGKRLSYECRRDDLTRFMRQSLDRRTAKLVSQMKQTDEVHSVKLRRRRSDGSHGFSVATDPLDIVVPASSLLRHPYYDKSADDDGSGEVMPPADEITEGVIDNSDGRMSPSAAESDAADASRAKMMPYASVVLPRQSTSSLRTFLLNNYHHYH